MCAHHLPARGTADAADARHPERPVPLARPDADDPPGRRRGGRLGVHADPARRRDLRDRLGHVLRRRPGQQRRVGGRAHAVTGAVGACGRRRRGGRGRRRRRRPSPRRPRGRSSATRPTPCSRSWTPPGWSSGGRAAVGWTDQARSSAADGERRDDDQRHDPDGHERGDERGDGDGGEQHEVHGRSGRAAVCRRSTRASPASRAPPPAARRVAAWTFDDVAGRPRPPSMR